MNFQDQINEMTDQVLVAIEKAPILRRTNEDRLKTKGNIYFIFSNGQLKYIGQRQARVSKLDLHNIPLGNHFLLTKIMCRMEPFQNGIKSRMK